MDVVQKLGLLASQMHLESAEDQNGHSLPLSIREEQTVNGRVVPCSQVKDLDSTQARKEFMGITQAVMPGGKRINLLKTMLTSACERNCFYCAFRAGRNYRRETFKPEELAQTFMDLYRAGMVKGLFLSSGIIKGGITTQDKLIKTIDIVRNKMGFRGYIHLKVMPGAEREQVQQSMALANRVSVNLEGPNTLRLQMLAPKKVFVQELLRPLRWIEEIRREEDPRRTWNGRWASSATQFVVGAVGESDLELLTTSGYLYQKARLSRTYFMAFNPIRDTPLENSPPEDPWREHRLYQASYLLRDYGFDLEEIPFQQDGNLSLERDPKLIWAQQHLSEKPVELNKADREELIRVPGLGPKGVLSILNTRRRNKLRYLSDLKAIGVDASRPAPFVLLDGKRPTYQMRLF